jgi:hypothetical protein
MGDYLTIRDEARRVLAHLYATVDGDGDASLPARADEVLRHARRIVRRWPLDGAARGELLDLVGAIERVRAVLPLAA